MLRCDCEPVPAATAGVTGEEQDFEALFDRAPCGYLVTDDHGAIVAVNDTFCTWSGHDRRTLMGTNLAHLLPVGDRILYSTHLTPQLRIGGTVAEVLVEIIAQDGTRRPALLSAVREPGSKGAPTRVNVIVFSASERRRYEQELVEALRRARESDSRRAAAEAGLQHLVMHDPLTGLPNRRGLITHLREALEARAPNRLAVLFVDLDHFKAVNDSLGHSAGDELLVLVAERLGRCVGESALAARLSGDEFVIVDRVTSNGATALAQRILADLGAPVVIEGLEVVVSASIGIALADGTDDTAESLLRRADIAMYRAKSRGRNCVQLHDRTRVDPEIHRLKILGELRAGIAAGELRVHYQPRIELQNGRCRGVEALVRWQHPVRGLLSPVDFIDIAEESGLIRALGAWVLREAVSQAARWQRSGVMTSTADVAVNLSVRQLAQPDIVHVVASVLSEHGFDPARLTLEITETALMSDPQLALATIRHLRDLGVKIAIDDFGTGYGSLSYLQQFPVDELKIDRSFVSGLRADMRADESAIVGACVQLAHAVGIPAVAEGVESHAERLALIALGCDLAQGYLFARPLPSSDLAAWLQGRRAGRHLGLPR